MYITANELREIKEKIINNKLTYNSYIKYYKLFKVLNDKELLKILLETIPCDLNEYNEDKFYSVNAVLKYKFNK